MTIAHTNLAYIEENELPTWVKWVKRQWGAFLHLITFIVTSLAEHGVEIAARAIGIAAPLPNAISVYKISMDELDFNRVQALAFSFVIEVVVFALVEIALYLFDGYLRDKAKYRFPLAAAAASVIVAVCIVIGLVYNLEVAGGGHVVMAWMPVISLCAFVSIGLKRWNERQKEFTGSRKRKPAKSREISGNSGASVEKMNQARKQKIQDRHSEIFAIISENGPMAVSEISALLSSNVSDKTLSNDLNSLADEGRLIKDGRKWSIKPTVIERVPERAGVYVNGNGAA